MQITISYPEIERFIQTHYQRMMKIQFVDSQTFAVSYSPYRFMPSVQVHVRIQNLSEETVVLVYNGRRGVNLIIRGLLSFMKEKINTDFLSVDSKRQIIWINLNSINGIDKAYQYITPSDIYFDQERIHLTLEIR